VISRTQLQRESNARHLWPWIIVFFVGSILDVVLTWMVVDKASGVEANPLAAAYLERHGWFGLGVFKLGGMAVFLGSIVLILRRRPGLARGLLQLACLILFVVLVYSAALWSGSRAAASTREPGQVEQPAPVAEFRRLPMPKHGIRLRDKTVYLP
jgi:hypothetical protein